jgi:hypothetical protein
LINDAFKPALQIVEREWRKERTEGKARKDKGDAGTAALVIVGRLDQDKFFSNGVCALGTQDVSLNFFFGVILNRLQGLIIPVLLQTLPG